MSTQGKVQLRREINLLHATMVMAGITIGSGIFVSPVSLARNSGSVAASLILWVVCGVLTLFVSLTFTELGGMFPSSGGEYHYFHKVLGPLPGFLWAWAHFMAIQPAFFALLALTTTIYLFEALFGDCRVPMAATKLTSILFLVTVVALNSTYTRYVARVHTLLTSLKVLALVIVVVTGIVNMCRGQFGSLSSGFEGTNPDPGGHAIGIYSGIFTYMGWQYIFCLMEEVKAPERVITRAVVLSTLLVTALFFFTNVAYFTMLTPQEMIQSPAVAMTFAEKAMGKVSKAVPFFVSCATIGSLNGSVLGASRMFFAAARDGLFPNILATIHTKYNTPWASLFSVGGISILYIITGEALTLLEYLGMSATLMMLVGTCCVLYLRWRAPSQPRPWKVPLALPVISAVVLLAVLVLGVYHQPYNSGICLLLLLSGLPVYAVGVLWVRKPKSVRKWTVSFYAMVQKTLSVVEVDQ